MNTIINQLTALVNQAPIVTFTEAVKEVGLDNMCSVKDLALLKSIFASKFYTKNPDNFYVIPSDRPYFWSNEYIGRAPINHPAEGKIIIAKIEEVVNERKIRISAERYDLCPGWNEDDASYYIKGFVKGINGLMAPVSNRKENLVREKTVIGPLHFRDFSEEGCCPIALRPASWNSDLVFTSCNPLLSDFKVIRRDSFYKILLPLVKRNS